MTTIAMEFELTDPNPDNYSKVILKYDPLSKNWILTKGELVDEIIVLSEIQAKLLFIALDNFLVK